MKECTYDDAAFELFGVRTPEAEANINGRDATDVTARPLSQDTYGDVITCESGVTAQFERVVTKTWNDFTNVQQGGTFMYDGAAHPGNFVDYSHVTWDLRTGKPIGEKDVFTKIPESLIDRCRDWYPKEAGWEGAELELSGHTFVLVPHGIQVFGTSYGHAMGVLTGRGPVLTWGALLREGALRTDSPAKRAWQDAKRNGAPDPAIDCEKDD
jgi:hypothetical protein